MKLMTDAVYKVVRVYYAGNGRLQDSGDAVGQTQLQHLPI